MTSLLEQAIAEIQKLSPDSQDAIAAFILEELADEQRWQSSFDQSNDLLAAMAKEARKDRPHAEPDNSNYL